jgi:hypothetical protein
MEFATSIRPFCLHNCRSGVLEVSPLDATNGKESGMRVDSISMAEDWNLARSRQWILMGWQGAGSPSTCATVPHSKPRIQEP